MAVAVATGSQRPVRSAAMSVEWEYYMSAATNAKDCQDHLKQLPERGWELVNGDCAIIKLVSTGPRVWQYTMFWRKRRQPAPSEL
jgi:hypothetical protein